MKKNIFSHLKFSILKNKKIFGYKINSLFRDKKINDDLFKDLEEQLLISDVNVITAHKIVTNLANSVSYKQSKNAEILYDLLKYEMKKILIKVDKSFNTKNKSPFIILIVGVNGVGKTTTIAKLANQFKQHGESVMLAAGDTFRSAAAEQLQILGKSSKIPVIAQHAGADAASVIFDAIQASIVRNINILIADTAGRLQNNHLLMNDLKKIIYVMKKLDKLAPHETMLIIDAESGQNALNQVELFHKAIGLTGITLTKLDGTAKGGVIFSIADRFDIPIRYIGTGKHIDDLHSFNANDFIEVFFAKDY